MCAQLSPYFVIRTEREAIHAVALGSNWTRLLERPKDTEDDDIEAAFQAKNAPSNPNDLDQGKHDSSTTTSNSKDASNDSSNGHWLLGKEQSFVKAPEGSDGIFDDDTEDDDDRRHSLKDDPANAEGSLSFGMLDSEDQNLRLPEVVTLSTVDTRIAYVGGSRGSIGVYDSETGRVLDRVEGAHGDNSVLLVEELLSDDQGIIFASQARDGYIRFWTVYAESGVSEASTLPLLASKRMRICLRPFSSPVFVGGEAFCKASFLKKEGLAATCSERGSIAVWNYQDVLSLVPSKASPNSTLFSPKCIVSYEGDKYGMCMSLQLIISSERTPTLLFAGFEDGSILAWSLSEVDSISPDGQHQVVLFYSLMDSFRPFATTPVLSFSMLNFASLLERQELSPQDPSYANNSSYMECSDKGLAWVGVCTSSEETIVTFLFGFCGANGDLSSSKGHFSTMDSYITPHGGYQDVQIREDSLVAVAGWDHRIRLFLLEASSGATPTQFRLQLRSLAILRYHAASVQSVALGDPSSRLLASASTDQKVALWKVF
jgi:WD40 repeat protein